MHCATQLAKTNKNNKSNNQAFQKLFVTEERIKTGEKITFSGKYFKKKPQSLENFLGAHKTA